MSTVSIQGSETNIYAVIDSVYGPCCNYLLLSFGALSVDMLHSCERKAFIAALQAADAELDAAAEAWAKKEEAAA